MICIKSMLFDVDLYTVNSEGKNFRPFDCFLDQINRTLIALNSSKSDFSSATAGVATIKSGILCPSKYPKHLSKISFSFSLFLST